MAGGLLRAALRAGNVRQVLSASLAASRRARGVRQMNRSLAAGGGGRALGLGGDRSYGASDYLMRRGRPGKFLPYDAVYDDAPSYLSPTAGGGFGRVSRFPDGRRVMFPSEQSGGALSPVEGGRAWPFRADSGVPFSYGAPPAWVGRGRPPRSTYMGREGFDDVYAPSSVVEPYGFVDPDTGRHYMNDGTPVDSWEEIMGRRDYPWRNPTNDWGGSGRGGAIEGWDY